MISIKMARGSPTDKKNPSEIGEEIRGCQERAGRNAGHLAGGGFNNEQCVCRGATEKIGAHQRGVFPCCLCPSAPVVKGSCIKCPHRMACVGS